MSFVVSTGGAVIAGQGLSTDLPKSPYDVRPVLPTNVPTFHRAGQQNAAVSVSQMEALSAAT
jgi:hypothetical protein